jgi:hypothetical protein
MTRIGLPRRGIVFGCVFGCVIGFVLAPGALRADQPRDWMVAAQPAGTYLSTDLVFPGVQATLEHRIPIYGAANELDLKVNALPTLYYYESQVDVELRILVLTLGLTAGFRDTFFNLSFDPGESFSHEARRAAEDEGDYANELTGYGEARAQLGIPFNEWIALLSVFGARYEGGQDRTFDWRLGIMRDSGVLMRSNTTLFFHHREFGAIGPQLEVLSYDLDGERNTGIHYGFTYVGRVGLRDRYDLLFLTLLFGTSGKINGVETEEVYGDHWFKLPLTLQLAYRIVWELSGPNDYDDDTPRGKQHVLYPEPPRPPRQ